MEEVFLLNARSKDFLLGYINFKLKEDLENAEYLISKVGIDDTLILILSLMEETGVKYGDKLTISYVLKFYTMGLSFSEIAWIKDITEDGIRYNLHTLVKDRELSTLKYIHSQNRSALKDRILMFEIINRVETLGYEETCKELGYTELYFKRLYRKLIKLKEEFDLKYEKGGVESER